MVGKAQQIDDPGTKHPGSEITDYEDKLVWRNMLIVIMAIVAFAVLLFFLGATNVIH